MKRIVCALLLMALAASFCSCASVTSRFYADYDMYSVGASEVSTTVSSLDVAWADGKVNVSYYDGTTVKFYEECDKELSEDDQLHYFLDGATLRIRFSKPKLLTLGVEPKTLYIQIPASLELDITEISVASAKMEINGIKTDKLFAETASGNVTLNNVTVKSKVDIESASGNVNATLLGDIAELDASTASGNLSISAQKINEIDVDSASGLVKLDLLACPEELDVDTASANVEIALPSDAQFTLEFDSASGELENAFECTKLGDKYVCGISTAEIKIDTASGDLRMIKKG